MTEESLSPAVQGLLDRAASGEKLSADDVVALLQELGEG
ncbi:MAG: hypothetical protein QOJ65_1775 [Fimbriimonadaceae bacterium]|jgi:hypothetical protein|nr:hypothetical protein [Fimbriimonadaceae bacterium]